MAIITISRQNGSLGDEIADALAARLGTTVISRKYALDNFFGEINPGTLDRLNESAKFFETTLPGSNRTYADILVEKIRTINSEQIQHHRIALRKKLPYPVSSDCCNCQKGFLYVSCKWSL